MKTLIIRKYRICKAIFLIPGSKACTCISIHQNSYDDSGVKGPQVFIIGTLLREKNWREIIQEKLNDLS